MACNIDETLGAWSELAYITVWKCGDTTGAEYASLTETIDIEMGKKDIEYKTTLSGGRIGKRMPQEDTTITFEGYPLTVGGEITGNATGYDTIFQGGSTWPTGDHKVTYATPYMDTFMVAILWTNDTTTSPLTAVGTTTAGFNAYRQVFVNALAVEMKHSFTDKMLKTTFKFKIPSANKWGVSNIRTESVTSAGSAGLPQISAFNASNFPQDGTAYTWEV